MNLERVNEERSEELNLPVGSILLSQMEYVIEVLMKFEPSLQLKITEPLLSDLMKSKNAQQCILSESSCLRSVGWKP